MNRRAVASAGVNAVVVNLSRKRHTGRGRRESPAPPPLRKASVPLRPDRSPRTRYKHKSDARQEGAGRTVGAGRPPSLQTFAPFGAPIPPCPPPVRDARTERGGGGWGKGIEALVTTPRTTYPMRPFRRPGTGCGRRCGRRCERSRVTHGDGEVAHGTSDLVGLLLPRARARQRGRGRCRRRHGRARTARRRPGRVGHYGRCRGARRVSQAPPGGGGVVVSTNRGPIRGGGKNTARKGAPPKKIKINSPQPTTRAARDVHCERLDDFRECRPSRGLRRCMRSSSSSSLPIEDERPTGLAPASEVGMTVVTGTTAGSSALAALAAKVRAGMALLSSCCLHSSMAHKNASARRKCSLSTSTSAAAPVAALGVAT